jgi:hypothetical protein
VPALGDAHALVLLEVLADAGLKDERLDCAVGLGRGHALLAADIRRRTSPRTRAPGVEGRVVPAQPDGWAPADERQTSPASATRPRVVI